MNTMYSPQKNRSCSRSSGTAVACLDAEDDQGRAAELPLMDDFPAIYDLYQAAIVRYCYGQCRDHATGQDLAQMTFLRFWLCLQREERILHVRAFLYRIARNLVIDHIRKKKEDSLDALLETGFEPTIDLWNQTYSRLDAERVLKKIHTMRPSYTQVLHDHFIRGFTPAEIATVRGESPNAVSVRICRGLKHLRLLLEVAPLSIANIFVKSIQ